MKIEAYKCEMCGEIMEAGDKRLRIVSGSIYKVKNTATNSFLVSASQENPKHYCVACLVNKIADKPTPRG